jgi:hypothetical protein
MGSVDGQGSLSLRCLGCCLLQNWGCPFDVRDTEEHQRSIRSRFQATICVADTNIGLSQSGGYACNLTGPVGKLGVHNGRLCLR